MVLGNTFFSFFSFPRVLPDLLDPLEPQVLLVVDSTLASFPSLRRRPLILSVCTVLMMLMCCVIVTWRWTAP